MQDNDEDVFDIESLHGSPPAKQEGDTGAEPGESDDLFGSDDDDDLDFSPKGRQAGVQVEQGKAIQPIRRASGVSAEDAVDSIADNQIDSYTAESRPPVRRNWGSTQTTRYGYGYNNSMLDDDDYTYAGSHGGAVFSTGDRYSSPASSESAARRRAARQIDGSYDPPILMVYMDVEERSGVDMTPEIITVRSATGGQCARFTREQWTCMVDELLDKIEDDMFDKYGLLRKSMGFGDTKVRNDINMLLYQNMKSYQGVDENGDPATYKVVVY